MKVKVNKDDLLKVLKENRETHRSLFLEALEGYREKVIELLTINLENTKAGKKIVTFLQLPVPTDQTSEYDQIIRMLEMSVDENFELDEHEFKCYVLDEWSWKEAITASNSRYLKCGD